MDGPDDIEGEGAGAARRREILALVEGRGFVTIDDLARQFEVSAQTIRRDIIRLDEQGLLQRFHGGAGLPERRQRLRYDEKRILRTAAKARIGQAAASIIRTGAAVYIDVGTTAEAVARELAGRTTLRAFTNSLAVAEILRAAEGAEVVVLGGAVRGEDGALVGPLTLAALAQHRLDVAVIGCSGFDTDGSPLDFDADKVAVKRLAMERSRETLLVADASKFAREALVQIAPLAAIGTLVTDAAPPRNLARALADAGTRIAVSPGPMPGPVSGGVAESA